MLSPDHIGASDMRLFCLLALMPAKRGGKRSGRGRTTLKTQHNFSRINTRSAMLCKWWWTVCDIFRRQALMATLIKNRLWPLNILSLIRTSITISEQYFHSHATVSKFSFFLEWQKELVAFGYDSSWSAPNCSFIFTSQPKYKNQIQALAMRRWWYILKHRGKFFLPFYPLMPDQRWAPCEEHI